MNNISRRLCAFILLCLCIPVSAADLPVGGLYPANGATNISPDTSLRITFPAAPMLGSGKIEIRDASDNSVVETIDLAAAPTNPAPPNAAPVTRVPAQRAAPTKRKVIGGLNNYNYYPALITGNRVEIFPAPGTLAYGKSYYVTIENGFFKGESDTYSGITDSKAWRFTTRAGGPAAGSTSLTVASDGSGDFSSLQAALDFIPDANTNPITITLRRGTYTELIYVANKHNITILGEDRNETKLEYATNDSFNNSAGGGGYRRGVFRANRCNDLTLANLTIRNTTPQGGTQAEAIIFNGNIDGHAIVANVDLYSYQDTLQINGQAYVANCYIEGDVDFMWGNGPCFFENCIARTVRNNAYYTQIRNPQRNHGYIYYRSTFDGTPGITGNVLSRIAPTGYPYSEVVLIDCILGPAVSPAAWRLDSAARGGSPTTNTSLTENIHFWEFNSRTPEGQPVDVSQRLSVSRQLKQPDDAEMIKQYSDPTWVLGSNWNPRDAAIFKKFPIGGGR